MVCHWAVTGSVLQVNAALPSTMESSISLEETNKIRIKLGLKPLVDDGAPTDAKEQAANENYAANKEREEKAKRARSVKPLATYFVAQLIYCTTAVKSWRV